MPPWAKLQFTNHGVTPRELDHVLRHKVKATIGHRSAGCVRRPPAHLGIAVVVGWREQPRDGLAVKFLGAAFGECRDLRKPGGAVAAGDGALSTLTTRSFSSITKSSTSLPSRPSA